MRRMRWHLAAVVFIILLAPGVGAQADFESTVDRIAADALKQPIAGLSIAIARRGQPLFVRGYGRARLDTNAPVTPATVFHVASISKNIEAAVAVRLAEQGKLVLDADVTKYVPNAPTHGGRVTIAQLLSHTSGLYNFTDLPTALANEGRDWTHDQVFSLFRDQPLVFAPGSRWRYSNSGFYLAGVAIERVTGQPYGTYVKNQIFAPLGMPTASLCTVHDTVASLASGYIVAKGALEPAPYITWSLPFAAGAICATAADLITWQQALENGRVISPAGVAQMRTPSRLNDGTTIDYGLGTRMGTLEGHRVVGHTGSGGGYKAILESFPDDGVMIAVLSNTETASVASVAGALARAALGLEPHEPVDSPVPPDEALAIAGTFDSDEGRIELFTCADRICFRTLDGAVRGTQKRRAPFVYDVGPEVVVRFDRRVERPDWAFVYSAGLLTDAKRRAK